MSEVTTIGLDIAKHVFHAHGADTTGRAVFSPRLTRGKLLGFFAAHPRCRVALQYGPDRWQHPTTGQNLKIPLASEGRPPMGSGTAASG